MDSQTHIAIIGAGGRMGRMLIEAVTDHPKCQLAGAIVRPNTPLIGQDCTIWAGGAPSAIYFDDDLHELLVSEVGVVIDFSHRDQTAEVAELCAQSQTPLVIGVTGISEQDEAVIKAAARHIPIVWAANYSVGVTLATNLAEKMAQTLPDHYDIEIVEMHHRYKLDAPSGTALALGQAAARGRGIDHDEHAIYERTQLHAEREQGAIGYAALRGGDVVGEHELIFAAAGERLSLKHNASSRKIFADGAVTAALWVADQPKGIYSMQDVLGLT